jgi:Cell wall-active antibiotics response 4TMS YvqF
LGDVVLDVRDARVTTPEVRLDAGSISGGVELLVPEGVEVEVRSQTLFGDINQDAGEPAPPGAPRIVLSGGTVFGDVRVRTRRLRERLADHLADYAGGSSRQEPRRTSRVAAVVSSSHCNELVQSLSWRVPGERLAGAAV